MCKPGVHPAVWLIDSAKDGAITEVRPIRDTDTNEANARLIAAAPAMLQTLKDMCRFMDMAFNAEGDTFGMDHNDATDALISAEAIIRAVEPR